MQTVVARQSDFLCMLSTLLTPHALQTLRCASKDFSQNITPDIKNKCVEAAVKQYTRATLFFTSDPCYHGHAGNGLRLHSKHGEHTADFFVWRDETGHSNRLSLNLGKLSFNGHINGEMFDAKGERCSFDTDFFCIQSDSAITKDSRVRGAWISHVNLIFFDSSSTSNTGSSRRCTGVSMRINVDTGDFKGVLHADHEFAVAQTMMMNRVY